jgi:hypothetical protein
MLPVGIVIPTRNSAELLRSELPHLKALLEHVTEAVVVDSSEDNTLDLLRQGLSGPKVQYLRHPPGLYQSWNYGVARITAPYLYISTAGDSITREGLAHLVETATNLGADVVVSPPEFRDVRGTQLPEKLWPVHELVARRRLKEPTTIDPWEAFLLQVVDAPKALIGSSASNLYRTAMLQKRPFPTDHGHFGDVAWGIENALETRLTVTPAVVSRFIIHASGSDLPIVEVERARARLMALAIATLDRQKDQAQIPPLPEGFESGLRRLPGATAEAWRLQQQYDAFRRGPWPWFLRPAAWQARRGRKQQNQALTNLKAKLIAMLGEERGAGAQPKRSHV